MPSEQIQRSTAKVVKISDIHNSQYTKQEGFAPNYVIINGEQVSRVNIIGTVISADEKSVSVDDGNSSIIVREFDTTTLNGIFLGDVVLVIGKIKEYGNQKYILPE
ncbi:hypothetical protein KY316_03090, partial [Candidatus Woesearchaeota archaeon]|nr:hypothetical protein [Candidatus Woesearchaeota archaeon]